MAITDRHAVVGTQVWWSPAGASSTSPSGTVSATIKPDADDAAWVKLPHVSGWSPERTGETETIRQPAPGRARAFDVIERNVDFFYRFTLRKVSPLFLQLLHGTGTLDGTASQFNHLSGFDIKGWLKVQYYNQSEVLMLTSDAWGHLKANSSPVFDPESESVRLECEFMLLHSTLNTNTPT